jgi:hypothetical protein
MKRTGCDSRMSRKGCLTTTAEKKIGLTDLHTCFESRNTMQIDYKP